MKTHALKAATIVVLFVGAQAVSADGGQTDDDPSVIKSLCRSKDAEGGYDWKSSAESITATPWGREANVGLPPRRRAGRAAVGGWL
jgi:hypothetical protein